MDIKKLLDQVTEDLENSIEKEAYFRQEAKEAFEECLKLLGKSMEEYNQEEAALSELYPSKMNFANDVCFDQIKDAFTCFSKAIKSCALMPQSVGLWHSFKLKMTALGFLVGILKYEESIKKQKEEDKKGELANVN